MPYTIIAAPAPEGDDEFDPNSYVASVQQCVPTLVSELERIPRILVRRNPFADARYDQYSEVPVRARRRPPRAGYHYGFLFDPRAR